VADKSFSIKNGLIVNTNVLWANAGQVGVNNSNPDANLTVTGNANLNGNVAISGIFTSINVSANVISVGANVTLNTTAHFAGNSTISFFANSTLANVSNTIQYSSLSAANIISGNSTYYSFLGLTKFGITNTSVTMSINTTGLYIGSNVSLIPDVLSIGNSTVNSVVNSSVVAISGQVLVAPPAFQILTSSATVNWNMALGYNAYLLANVNFTLAAPTNFIIGATYCLQIQQGNSGSHTITYATANVNWDFGSAGNGVLSTTNAANDFLFFIPYASNSTYVWIRSVFNKSALT